MGARQEVFDWSCRLFFYQKSPDFSRGGPDGEQQRFLAVPDDRSKKMVLRGVMVSPVSPLADHGRLYGIRRGEPSVLWPEESRKVGLVPTDNFLHDRVHYCIWSPDPPPLPEGGIAHWPSRSPG